MKIISISSCDKGIEDEILQYDIFIFAGALISILVSNKHREYASYFYRLIFVGVLLAALGITDIWSSKKNLFLYKHIRSILQIASTFVFVYLFYTFFFITYNTAPQNNDPFV